MPPGTLPFNKYQNKQGVIAQKTLRISQNRFHAAKNHKLRNPGCKPRFMSTMLLTHINLDSGVALLPERQAGLGFVFSAERFAKALGLPYTRILHRLDPETIQFAFDVDGCMLNSEGPAALRNGKDKITVQGLHDSSWQQAVAWALAVVHERNGPQGASTPEEIMKLGRGAPEPIAVDRMLAGIAKDSQLPFTRSDFINVRYHFLWQMLERAEDLVLPGIRDLIGYCRRNEIPMAINSSSSASTVKALFHHAFFKDEIPFEAFQKIVTATDFEKSGRYKPAPETWLRSISFGEPGVIDCGIGIRAASFKTTIILENSLKNALQAWRALSDQAVVLLLEPKPERMLENTAEIEYESEAMPRHLVRRGRLLVVPEWTELAAALKLITRTS